jgi:hypothetical protein
MPRGMRVPEYDLRVSPQAGEVSPMANPQAQTVDIEATEKLGMMGVKAGATILDTVLEHQRKVQDEESRNWTLKARPDFKLELDKIEAEYAGKIKGINDDGIRKEYIDKALSLSQKYKDLAGQNGVSWKYLEPHIESDITAAGTKLGALSKATRQTTAESGLQQNFGIELGHAKDSYFYYDGKNFSIESQWKNVASLIMGSGLDPDDKQKKMIIEKPRFYQEYAQLMLGDSKTAGRFVDVMKNEGAFNAYMSHLPQGSQGELAGKLKTAATFEGVAAEHDILNSLGNTRTATDSTQREEAIKEAENKLVAYGDKLKPEDRIKYGNMIRDYRDGKDIPTNHDILLDAKIGLYAGDYSVDDIRNMGGINASDKGSLLTLYYQVERQARATEKQGEALARSIQRSQFSQMLATAKEVLVPQGGTDSEKIINHQKFSQFMQDAWGSFEKGTDPFDFYNSNLFKYQNKGQIPFVSIRGVYQGTPQTSEQIYNLKTWVPYLIKNKRVKEANILADQINKAESIIIDRESRKVEDGGKPDRKIAK